VNRDFLADRFGNPVSLGLCIVGRDIDNVAIRGFAPLDMLAAISAPDVFDDEINPTGTQRDLKPKHAQASFEYATAQPSSEERKTRAFPEILLNVRDMQAVEIRDAEGNQLMFDSHSTDEQLPQGPVELVVNLDDIEIPKTTIGPEISRVDGNHRLDGPDRYLTAVAGGEQEDSKSFPTIPFMMFLNLSLDEEVKLFNDLNGQHEGMEPSLIVAQDVRLGGPEAKADPKRQAGWLAYQLTRNGRAFNDMVHIGGSRRGAKEAGKALRLNLSALRAAVALMIRHSHNIGETLADNPEARLEVIDNYWKAVAATFPDAWQNKRDFILLQSIGLNGFAEYGATIIDRQGGEIHVEAFREVLEGIKPNVSLEREAYEGIAGAGGAKLVAKQLGEASTEENIVRSQILSAIQGSDASPDTKVAALGDVETPEKPATDKDAAE
jgi:DGQHR domain-containing protein